MYKSRGEFLLFILGSTLMLNTLCTRNIYPKQSFNNIRDHSEKEKLNAFMKKEIEKDLTTYDVTPDDILETAGKYIGVPHCMGGTTRKCMDCSGLLFRVFADHGIKLPHNSEEQARYGRIISNRSNLKKGDLVFFVRSYNTHRFITHSGIYAGNNEFIHTSSSRGVTITSLDNSWWNEKFIFGTRIFK
ncbi:MAG: C40 family peptidase [Bacteroidota bacterium]